MRTFAWIFSGVLGLAALEAIIATPGGAGRFGQLLGSVASVVQRVMDPSVSAIPNLTQTPSSSPN